MRHDRHWLRPQWGSMPRFIAIHCASWRADTPIRTDTLRFIVGVCNTPLHVGFAVIHWYRRGRIRRSAPTRRFQRFTTRMALISMCSGRIYISAHDVMPTITTISLLISLRHQRRRIRRSYTPISLLISLRHQRGRMRRSYTPISLLISLRHQRGRIRRSAPTRCDSLRFMEGEYADSPLRFIVIHCDSLRFIAISEGGYANSPLHVAIRCCHPLTPSPLHPLTPSLCHLVTLSPYQADRNPTACRADAARARSTRTAL